LHDLGIRHHQLRPGDAHHILFNPDTETFCFIDWAGGQADHDCRRMIPLRDFSSAPSFGQAGCQEILFAGAMLRLWYPSTFYLSFLIPSIHIPPSASYDEEIRAVLAHVKQVFEDWPDTPRSAVMCDAFDWVDRWRKENPKEAKKGELCLLHLRSRLFECPAPKFGHRECLPKYAPKRGKVSKDKTVIKS
jgi:hypothetical protein